jgi:pSer/pThr/pTyr-binding forkhead associated (FHA) protein
MSKGMLAGTEYRVGRDPKSDIVVSDSRVSWRHAVLRVDRHAWILEDAGSTNGTFLGARRIGRVEISQNCVCCGSATRTTARS